MTATNIPSVSGVSTLNVPLNLSTPTVADATNGNSTPNNGRLYLFIVATAIDTVAVTRTATVDGATLAARSESVPVGTIETGPFPVEIFGTTLQYKAGLTTTHFIPIQR